MPEHIPYRIARITKHNDDLGDALEHAYDIIERSQKPTQEEHEDFVRAAMFSLPLERLNQILQDIKELRTK